MQPHLTVHPRAAARLVLERQGLLGKRRRVRKARGGEDVLATVRRLECVQLDPVSVVERNQHLVLAARLRGYRPEMLEALLDASSVFEYIANAACVLPIEDYPLLAGTRQRQQARLAERIERIRPTADRVLARLEAEGPLSPRAFDSEQRVRGYWDNEAATTKATSHALNLLLDSGRIMVARRRGAERWFDLPERRVPAGILDQAQRIHPDEADRLLLDKYLRAFRIFDAGDWRFGWWRMGAARRAAEIRRLVEGDRITPLDIAGIKRRYYVLAEDEQALREHQRAIDAGSRGRTTPLRFLPPLDSLLWRRERVADLFGFEYTWEMYIPAEKRRFGAYGMPILRGERLIGEIDARVHRQEDRLHVRAWRMEPGVRVSDRLRHQLHGPLQRLARQCAVAGVTLAEKVAQRIGG